MHNDLATAAVVPLDLGIAGVIRAQLLEKLHHLLHVVPDLLDQKNTSVSSSRGLIISS